MLQKVPYLMCSYFGNKLFCLYRSTDGIGIVNRGVEALGNMAQAFDSPLPSLHGIDFLFGIGCGMLLKMAVYLKGNQAKKYRHGIEYGSARWGTKQDIAPYMDEVFEKNVILTETEGLMMEGRPKDPKYARNKNVLVIGDSVIIGLS